MYQKSTANNDYTTVEKLAEVVTKLESRVSELTNAGLEKDKKLEALEKKLEELLKDQQHSFFGRRPIVKESN